MYILDNFKIIKLTMSSTAFPKVAFNNAPNVWPVYSESCSVAQLRSVASGMTAKRLHTKIVIELHPKYSAKSPRGKKTNRGLVFVLLTNSIISILVSSERPSVEALLTNLGVGASPFGDLPSSFVELIFLAFVSIAGGILDRCRLASEMDSHGELERSLDHRRSGNLFRSSNGPMAAKAARKGAFCFSKGRGVQP